jgi:hypothetical protein
LLNDEGEVIETTQTNGRGAYRLKVFAETSDYQVRVTPPPGREATTSGTRDNLISRGGASLSGVNFGLRAVTSRLADTLRGATPSPVDQAAAVDGALASLDPSTAAELAQ